MRHLIDRFGVDEAARRLGTSQPTVSRIRNQKQMPKADMVATMAQELRWSADRILGLPRPLAADMPAELVEAIMRGHYNGAAIEAAARLDLPIDEKGWTGVLKILDAAVLEAIEYASGSHGRPQLR